LSAAQEPDYDIVIAGGGMIGTTLSLALAPLKLKIAVVEAVARGDAMQPSFDDRSTALSRSTQRAFAAMGLWSDIAAAATPVRSIHVSERGRFGFSHIRAGEQGVEALGYVVINRVLGQVLQKAVADSGEIEWICPGKIVSASFSDDRATVVLNSPAGDRELDCRLLVAADGANSQVRGMMGIGASRCDYRQHAVIGNLQPDLPHECRAFERFTRQGPLAILPVADDRVAFVWILPPAVAGQMQCVPDQEFVTDLQDAFGLRLGKFSKVGSRSVYPLSLTRAHGLYVRRGVLVGNAAHGLHPVAAQGFNLGVRDIAALCDCIADACAACESTADPGALQVLEAYAEWRKADQSKLVQFTDKLVRLFGDRRPPVKILRNLGMLGFDLVPGVRRAFATHTMGLAGRLPRLSRGVPLS